MEFLAKILRIPLIFPDAFLNRNACQCRAIFCFLKRFHRLQGMCFIDVHREHIVCIYIYYIHLYVVIVAFDCSPLEFNNFAFSWALDFVCVCVSFAFKSRVVERRLFAYSAVTPCLNFVCDLRSFKCQATKLMCKRNSCY